MSSGRPKRVKNRPNYDDDRPNREFPPNLLFGSYGGKGTDVVWYQNWRLGVGNHAREKSELEDRYRALGVKLREAMDGLTSEQKALRGDGLSKFTAETFLVLWIMKFCYSLAHISDDVLEPLRAEFNAITKAAYDLVFPPPAGRKKK